MPQINELTIKTYTSPSDFPVSGANASYSDGVFSVKDAETTLSIRKNYKGLAGTKRPSSPSNNAGTSSFTFCVSIQLPYSFYAVRPFVYNGNAIATTGAACSIASVLSNSSPYLPAGGSLTPVTLLGASTFTVPGATSGAGTSGVVPSITLLDIIDLQSASRTDDIPGSILTARLSNPAGQVDLRATGYAPSTGIVKTGYISNENTLNAGSSITSFSAGPALGFEIYTNKRVVSIINAGDSISAGQGYESNNNSTSAPVVAVDSINSTMPSTMLSLINCGIGSTTSTSFYTNLVTAINTFPSIDVAIFSVGSPNDPDRFTTAWVSRMFRYMTDLILLCKNKNITLVFESMNPISGSSTAEKNSQLSFYNLLKQFCMDNNILFADRYNYYTNGSGSYKTGLSQDGVHPNKLGINGEAEVVFKPLFLSFL